MVVLHSLSSLGLVTVKSTLQMVVEALDLPIRLWVIGSGSQTMRSKCSHEVAPKLRLELASLICSYCGRHAESRNPALQKYACKGLSPNIYEWECFWPACEPVDHCQNYMCSHWRLARVQPNPDGWSQNKHLLALLEREKLKCSE